MEKTQTKGADHNVGPEIQKQRLKKELGKKVGRTRVARAQKNKQKKVGVRKKLIGKEVVWGQKGTKKFRSETPGKCEEKNLRDCKRLSEKMTRKRLRVRMTKKAQLKGSANLQRVKSWKKGNWNGLKKDWTLGTEEGRRPLVIASAEEKSANKNPWEETATKSIVAKRASGKTVKRAWTISPTKNVGWKKKKKGVKKMGPGSGV